MIVTEKEGRTRRKNCPSATFSTINLRWAEQALNLDLRNARSATNGVDHGTIIKTE
jgi:hypothetical protein